MYWAATTCSVRVGADLGEEARLLEPVARGRLVVVSHGVDLAYFNGAPLTGSGDTDVLMVAEFNHGRNAEAAVALYDAARSRASVTGNWRWTFAGRGSEELPIQGPNVTRTVTVQDARPFYRASRVVVVPARARAAR